MTIEKEKGPTLYQDELLVNDQVSRFTLQLGDDSAIHWSTNYETLLPEV